MTETPQTGPVGKRTVTIPTPEYLELQSIAEKDGVSLAAWMLDAARFKRARRAAEKAVAAMRDPEVRAEMDEFRAATAPYRQAARDRFDAMDREDQAA